MTPPSRSMMETRRSVVVDGSLASHRVIARGGESAGLGMGFGEGVVIVNRFLNKWNAMFADGF